MNFIYMPSLTAVFQVEHDVLQKIELIDFPIYKNIKKYIENNAYDVAKILIIK